MNMQRYFNFKWHYTKEEDNITTIRVDLISAPDLSSAKNIFIKIFGSYPNCLVDSIEEVDKNGFPLK